MKILFTLVAFCISACCFSQKGDYLVKNNGDTVWGNINLKHNVFYVTGRNQAEIYATDVTTIRSDDYKGNTVVRCNLQLYADNLADLELDYIIKGITDTVLILDEIYASPKINLYFVRNNFSLPFYFYKTPTDNKPVQLVIRYYLQGGLANYRNDPRRYRGENSRVNIVEDKGYVNQLFAIMGACKKIPEPMWELLTYRDYSLIQLIKKYNKCK